nr:rod shape-determining protein MreD [uncultured Flavobacterium sp.]
MNSVLIQNTIRFVLLLAIQIFIFNNINLSGYINPYPYILFILLYPINANRNLLLLASFSIGIIMDMFMNTGGVHTTACITLAYFRPTILKFTFGLSYEYQTVKVAEKLSSERFMFILMSILLHHIILFTLEIFKIDSILDILLRTIFSSIFTLIVSIIIIYLIKPNK